MQEDCKTTEWKDLTPCMSVCGPGYKMQYITILSQPTGGGAPCPTRTRRLVFCVGSCEGGATNAVQGEPQNCVVSPWSNSPKFPCYESCAYTVQTRNILAPAANGGLACPNVLSRFAQCSPGCSPTLYEGKYRMRGTDNVTLRLSAQQLIFGDDLPYVVDGVPETVVMYVDFQNTMWGSQEYFPLGVISTGGVYYSKGETHGERFNNASVDVLEDIRWGYAADAIMYWDRVKE